MNKVLVILAHPEIEKSIGNKAICNELDKDLQIEVRDLTQLYPDFKINVEAEQEALLASDVIIFQFPLYWYNMPAILKEWKDKVFTYGFAFGKDTYKLEGKKIIASFTTGSSSKDYPENVIEKITFPFRGLAKFCKMDYITEVISHEINNYSDEAVEKSITSSSKHAQQLINLVS